MATLRPASGFSAEDDAKALRKAMKGMGTDESAIIEVLCARSAQQRQEIKKAYKQTLGRDLIKDLKSETGGNFEDLLVALMTPLDEYLAQAVKKAIKGVGTDEDTLIEILCTRGNAEINAIKDAYKRLFGKDMEEQVADDLSGDLKHLMVALMNAGRPENAGVNVEKARKDARDLRQAGVKQWGTDEEAFIAVFCSNSFEQLRATFHEYRALAGEDIMTTIEGELSGDLKKAMLAMVKSIFNTPLYFAERLHKAMDGLGTDDKTLVRIIISRCEIDLAHIRAEYLRVFDKTLERDIRGDASGDYQTALMAIVRQN